MDSREVRVETGSSLVTDITGVVVEFCTARDDAPSLTIPVLAGRPALGTWQSIVVVDSNVDNRTRTVRLSFLPG